MVRKFAALSGAVAVMVACSLASVPAYSVPVSSLKADSTILLVKKGGGNKHWSGKGHGGKKWSHYGKWHGGDRYRGGYWRNGLFVTLPFIVGDQCYDYLDYSDGAPRPGWYWVC